VSTKRKFKVSFPSQTEMVMEREFDAPREMVFDAHLDPEAIPQWWGWRESSTEVVEMDVRVGGKYRFISHTKAGEKIIFFGEYREITPHEKFINTFGFEGMPGEPGEEVYSFTDLGNSRTLLRVSSKIESKDDLDPGMEEGANESYDQLDEYLAERIAA
jgi:uncharacterized protein YndB with AHSA1/START domain